MITRVADRTGTAKAASGITWAISDALIMTRRNLLKYTRVPTLIVFSTIQPVMFVLLFAFVFGGAIAVPGVDYINFLMAGIFIQVTVFGSTTTGVSLADDMSKGMIERFRSLPMSRSAVLAGRTIADSVRNLFVVLLMTAVGHLIGFRFQAGFFKAVAALLLAVLFGFAFSWISATIGLAVRDVESAQASTFVWVFPLVFASSAFVPTQTMPGWLQAFANNTPVTHVVNAVRHLMVGDAAAPLIPESLGASVAYSIVWIAAILAFFMMLAVRLYRRAV